MELRVWQDAKEYYVLTCRVVRGFPYDLKRVVSQAIGCADSVHRNVAEGYCRRSLKEYLNFLNIALGSIGESVSGLVTYSEAEQISPDQFEALDSLAFKIENGLLRLVESLERKRIGEAWSDQNMVKESNAVYQTSKLEISVAHDPSTPTPHEGMQYEQNG